MLFSGCYAVEIVDGEVVDLITLIANHILESSRYVIAIVSILVTQNVIDAVQLAVRGV